MTDIGPVALFDLSQRGTDNADSEWAIIGGARNASAPVRMGGSSVVPGLAEGGDDIVSGDGLRDHASPEALGRLSFEVFEPGWGD